MKILFLSHEFPPLGGGAASALDYLSLNLAQQKCKVLILTIGESSKNQLLVDEFGREIIRIKANRKNKLSPTLKEVLRSFFALIRHLPSKIMEFQPDVIVAYFAFPSGLIALPFAKLYRIPLIVSVRGSDAPGFWPGRWGNLLFLKKLLVFPALHFTDAIIANGEFLSNLVNSFLGQQKSVSIPNGVDTDKFYPLIDTSIENSQIRLLFVGQFISRKGCLELINALEILAKKGITKFSITFTGAGPMEQTLKQFYAKWSKKLNVKIVLNVSREEIASTYRNHDVLVLLSKAEGISNVILEALSSGLCIIASKTAIDPSIKNIPFLEVDESNPKDISDKIKFAIENRERVQFMKKESRKIAEKMDWAVRAHQFMNYVQLRILKKFHPY